MLELFVVYPSGRLWTAELLRRDENGEHWRIMFSASQSDREVLVNRLCGLRPGVALVDVKHSPLVLAP